MQSPTPHIFDDDSLEQNNLEVLAVGTSAVVYALSDACVLKKYPSANESFQRETLVYERLGPHDNIARLFRTTTTGIVLERGECLRKVLQGRERRDHSSENLIWAIQAAEGLLHMHLMKVVDADVGPHNLILVDSKQIKWLDFEGSGIDDQSASASYDIHYWRPTEGNPSVDTDIFAFGCLLFEIEQGWPPYSDIFGHLPLHERVKQIERLYSEGQYPDVSGLFFGQIILACWNGRFRDMAEVLVALRRLSSRPLQETGAESKWKWMAVMVSTAVFGGFLLRYVRRKR
jgi:serine/threonine protein kinase